MPSKWVDNDDYFGPDRRARRAARLRERRRFDETSDQPSLSATLRRLRVLLGHPTAEDAYNRALHLVGAAIVMAEAAQINECVTALRRADDALRTTPGALSAAEPMVGEAMAYL